jgi:hypothetical protein
VTLLGPKPREQRLLAVEQVGERGVYDVFAALGERDEHAAAVPRIGLARHQARGGEPVDAVGHRARGDQRGAQQGTRGELERRPRPAQRR